MKEVKWGLFIGGELMVSYSSYHEAIHALNYVYEETGSPHELKLLEATK